MTTPRPTGSDLPAAPEFAAEPPEVPLDGALDVARMTAIANELFRALPGAVAEVTRVEAPLAEPAGRRGTGVSIGSTPSPASPVAKSEIPETPADLPALPAGEKAVAPVFYFLGDRGPRWAAPGEADLVAGLPGLAAPEAPATPGTAAPLSAPVDQVGRPAATNASPFYFLTERPALAPTDPYAHGEAEGLPGAEAEAQPGATPRPGLDIHAVRRDFPILAERVNGRPLVWFDNAATTQKPRAVIDRLTYFYEHENSNIQRSAHELARRATDAHEAARETVARFLGATSDEIIFVRGTTEAINLVAATFGRKHIGPGDEVIISHLEHHANIVPWQLLAKEVGFTLKVIPVDEHGDLLLDDYRQMLSERTKLVSVTQVSNALGTVTPVKEIIDAAHAYGAKVLIDGAQSVAHMPVDVTALDADFFVFSGHKIYGPTGIGALYGRKEILDDLPPYQGGGHMIADVTLERALFNDPPTRFEAGTGNIADVVGLGAALDYVSGLGLAAIGAYEHDLLHYATPRLQAVPGLTLVGTAKQKASVLSFVLDGFDTTEVGARLNEDGIAVRSGHHCAQPILRRYGLEATVRPSLALYNTFDEVDCLVDALHRLVATRRRVD